MLTTPPNTYYNTPPSETVAIRTIFALGFSANGSLIITAMPTMQNSPASEDQRYEQFVTFFARHEADLRRFISSFLPPWGDDDEILQQTAIAIWRKFDQFDPSSDFMKWACVIARFEALAYRRKKARDRLVFHEDLLELMAEEAASEINIRQAERDALASCLQQLPERQRQFVLLSYTPGVKITELAKQAGSTAAAFYMRLKRLRRQLMQCVEGKTLNANSIS